jgi:hypothetical protein
VQSAEGITVSLYSNFVLERAKNSLSRARVRGLIQIFRVTPQQKVTRACRHGARVVTGEAAVSDEDKHTGMSACVVGEDQSAAEVEDGPPEHHELAQN